MFLKNSKLCIVVLMLLTFAGQASFAATLTCQMETSNQPSVMDHSTHMMGEQNSDLDVNFVNDCCSEVGNCSMSGCITISLAFLNVSNASEKTISSESILSPINLVSSQALTTLYRPPILS